MAEKSVFIPITRTIVQNELFAKPVFQTDSSYTLHLHLSHSHTHTHTYIYIYIYI